MSVSVTNSSERGELISQELAFRQLHTDVTAGGLQCKESHILKTFSGSNYCCFSDLAVVKQ